MSVSSSVIINNVEVGFTNECTCTFNKAMFDFKGTIDDVQGPRLSCLFVCSDVV